MEIQNGELLREGTQRAYDGYSCDRVASLLEQANHILDI